MFLVHVSCAEIYNKVAAASEDCPLCKPAMKSNGRTGSSDRDGDEQVCPQCRHALSHAIAVDKFTCHSECSPADSEVSSAFCQN